jgi:predicted metal-dependent hydrolase
LLFNLKSKPKPKAKPVIPAAVGGIRVKYSVRARRMALRVDARAGEVVLTWPARGTSERAALRFVEENRAWIEKQQSVTPTPSQFVNGDRIDVYGESYIIVHQAGRGITRLQDGQLMVHGAAEHLHRRVKDFLKKEALRVLSDVSTEKSLLIKLKAPQVRVIDPKTRWGSCGHDGRLMYSWRLIMAPADVLDYVVAHEVAHRIHMNHSRKFWMLCLSLCDDGAASRRWLKQHGRLLMGYQ